jgi:hypothetical protein
MSRIGNFPGRALLRSKFHKDSSPSLPFPLAIERLARETENSIDESTLLTDFQYKLYTALGVERSLSVSAPTSAGKSHVLNLDLVRRLKRDVSPCIVYVVPTRALVSEVVNRVRSTVRNEEIGNAIVRTAPFPVKESDSAIGVVYVLTQERLLRLLSILPATQPITTLIIDEAHELQKGKRGILLQNAIDIALRKFPQSAVLFASPLISNPAYLLSTFGRSESGRYFVERVSPVSQNIILITDIAKKPKKIDVSLLRSSETIHIGQCDLDFSFRGAKAEQKARFSLLVCGDDESVIVFSDDASDAEDCADLISTIQTQPHSSSEITDFISFIKSEIHPEYPLVDCLKKGVAFHYGNMPSIVRNGVERMFKEGKIRYLCSTSTLLQGVNLPAKHIVIHKPHLGKEKMGRADFRNLAGRAGRLLKEFHGNVWCLRPSEWGNDCYKGDELQEIKGAMDSIMEDGGRLIGAVADGVDTGENADLADAAFSRLYHQVAEHGADAVRAQYESEQNSEVLVTNLNYMSDLEIDIPFEILESHRSLRPDQLQKLFNLLRAAHHLENYLLINPHEKGGKDRMMIAIATINQAFDIPMADKYFNMVCAVAHKWAWGTPIGEIIGDRVSYSRSRDPSIKASPVIRDLLKLIESDVRYKLVKHFAAYEDLVRLAWLEQRNVPAPVIAPYHIYLEFGSSEQILLSLMALGLSRFTAIKLKNVINWNDEQEPEHYLARIMQHDIRTLPIPRLCKLEIYDLVGEI